MRITKTESIQDGYIQDHFSGIEGAFRDQALLFRSDQLKVILERVDPIDIIKSLILSFPESAQEFSELLSNNPSRARPSLPTYPNRELRHLLQKLLPTWQLFESFCEAKLPDFYWLISSNAERSQWENLIFCLYSTEELVSIIQTEFPSIDIFDKMQKGDNLHSSSTSWSQLAMFNNFEQPEQTIIDKIAHNLSLFDVRNLLRATLVTTTYFFTFLVDHYPNVAGRISESMLRSTMENILLGTIDSHEIVKSLYASYPEDVIKYFEVKSPNLLLEKKGNV